MTIIAMLFEVDDPEQEIRSVEVAAYNVWHAIGEPQRMMVPGFANV